jgi:hypothetical protein
MSLVCNSPFSPTFSRRFDSTSMMHTNNLLGIPSSLCRTSEIFLENPAMNSDANRRDTDYTHTQMDVHANELYWSFVCVCVCLWHFLCCCAVVRSSRVHYKVCVSSFYYYTLCDAFNRGIMSLLLERN